MTLHHRGAQFGPTKDIASASLAPSAMEEQGMAAIMPPGLDMTTILQQSVYSTQDIAFSGNHDIASHPLLNSQHLPSQYETLNITYDAPMSFRDRHRFLDGVYNSHPDPEAISAKNLENISRRAGLSMEEVLSWFGDEKARRQKLLAYRTALSQPPGHQFPPSPDSTTTPGPSNTVTMSMTQYISSPSGTLPQVDDIFSPLPVMPSTPSGYRLPAPVRAKRGRPARPQFQTPSDSLDSKSPPDAKRQKCSAEYPCPDCKSLFAADRYSEHVKRVHFPDNVWECPKINVRTGKACSANPSSRPDNFGTHLRREHGCGEEEIAQLKTACKFRVINLFHQICGFCDETFENRDDSIEHIKNHFKEISERSNPPEDKGLSEWKDKCNSDHKLKRGIHYRVNEETDNIESSRDGDDEDRDFGGGPSQGNSYNPPHGHSQHQQDGGPPADGGDEFGENSGFSSGSMSARCYQTCAKDTQAWKTSSIGLEGFTQPFTSLRKLGSGGQSSVDEVVSAAFKQTFARKSVVRRRTELTASSQMAHLKNELAVLKKLSHPHLVKLIGAYTDSECSHIIMSPVADINLADYLRSPQSSEERHMLRWMGCLTSATTYLHSKNVRHLDIKPQNILVKGESILLADFGAAKSFSNEWLEDPKRVALTPMYCAPETILDGLQEYDSDIFSLGCVFSEMVTRHFGFSLQEFEDFRSSNGNKAFHLTISETKEWILSLPSRTISEPPVTGLNDSLGKLLEKIVGMIAEAPSNRTTTKDLQISFIDIDHGHCASRLPIESALDKAASEQANSSGPKGCLVFGGCASEAHNRAQPLSPASNMPYLSGPAFHVWDPVSCNEGLGSGSDLPHATWKKAPTKMAAPLSLYQPPDNSQKFLHTSELGLSTFGYYPGNLDEFDFTLYSTPLTGFVDPSLLHDYASSPTVLQSYGSFQESNYPPSPVFSPPSLFPQSSSVLGSPSSHSPFLASPSSLRYDGPSPNTSCLYPPPQLPSTPSRHSYSSCSNLDNDETREKGRCTYPECGKVFKDLKAHMLTHQSDRPEKCPINTCDYHIKGFARKYDKNRHTLTHYKGTMVCGFCAGSGTAAEKSFNRADVFKRHLTSVHAVEQLPPNSRRRLSSASEGLTKKPLSGYAPDSTAKCSTCDSTFGNAQDFYEHLDDCVLRIVQQEMASEPPKEVDPNHNVEVTSDKRNNDKHKDPNCNNKNSDDFSMRFKYRSACSEISLGISTEVLPRVESIVRRKRRAYPSSWGFQPSQMKKRTLCVFDGPRSLNEDTKLNEDYEVRIGLDEEKAYVTDCQLSNTGVQTKHIFEVI